MGNKMQKIISKKYHPNLLVSINVSCREISGAIALVLHT